MKNDNVENVIKDLKAAFDTFDEMDDAYYDFMPIAEKIIERLEALPNPLEAFSSIFKLIENTEQAEYGLGTPGDIGHFLEGFYGKGYEQYLLESLDRKPTSYTVFLLQRIIRDPEDANRLNYLSLLKKISTGPKIDDDLRCEIIDTLKDFE